MGRRWLLAIVSAIIAVVLLVGGIQLASLGGSLYYLVAGSVIALTAWFAFRGDQRAVWSYVGLLLLTAIWAIWESGGNPWGLQARLLAPLVFGVWVTWPVLRQIRPTVLVIVAAIVIIGPAASIGYLDRQESVDGGPTPSPVGSSEWDHYGNDAGGSRFSGLTQINLSNVSRLKQAWVYRTGIMKTELGFEATPLMVGGNLFICTSNNVVIALDAESGRERWRHDPKVQSPPHAACRGVAYYATRGPPALCQNRILYGTTDARLGALDATTGRPCPDFGSNGIVDLKVGMGEVKPGYYYVSSAPTVVRGKVVLGGWVIDNQEVGEPSGVIRAFDAVTGKLAWAWDVDRPDDPNEPAPGKTYSRGTPNSWAPMSADETMGIVYVPTGNSTPDYWGGHRSAGAEKYSSSVVALDAETGRARWSFQTVHHDIWDYDVGSQPTLVDLRDATGGIIPALVQPTKRSQIFLLDRRDGKPLAPVAERPVPQGASQGDYSSPTQPFATGGLSLDDTVLSEATMWGLTPVDELWCRIKFREARYDGPMTPPGLRPTLNYPGYAGGVDWGSAAVDPDRQLLLVTWSRAANYMRLVTRTEADKAGVNPSPNGGIPQMSAQKGTPFAMATATFLSPLSVPCTQPPFGMIGAIDLRTQKMLWKRPLGTSYDSGPFYTRSHLPLPIGLPIAGGALVTRADLTFVAATQDRAIRAFRSSTGKLLWSSRLPRAGNATPMTYISSKSQRQFIVITAGGNMPMGSAQGDYVVGFTLDGKD
jgi:quinoprotein glucose dehydrogenase